MEVRYAGVVVGRGAVLRDQGDAGTFVGIAEPLPVGTLVTLKVGDSVREARVEEVVESAEPSAVGMRIRWGAEPQVAAAPVSAPAQAPTPAPTAAAPAASPAAEVDDSSGAIPAPMSLAGDSGQHGGKKRRKRR